MAFSNAGVRRTGKAVLHLFKEATQSYSLIMRDPVTSGDIWKTLPDRAVCRCASPPAACQGECDPTSSSSWRIVSHMKGKDTSRRRHRSVPFVCFK